MTAAVLRHSSSEYLTCRQGPVHQPGLRCSSGAPHGGAAPAAGLPLARRVAAAREWIGIGTGSHGQSRAVPHSSAFTKSRCRGARKRQPCVTSAAFTPRPWPTAQSLLSHHDGRGGHGGRGGPAPPPLRGSTPWVVRLSAPS
jgi:hypothetical protein